MKDFQNLCNNEINHDLLDDEIDMLYCQLEQIEPPTTLVNSILASVASLPLPHAQSEPEKKVIWDDLQDLLLGGINLQLS